MSYHGYISLYGMTRLCFNMNISVYTCLFKLPTAYVMSRRYMHLELVVLVFGYAQLTTHHHFGPVSWLFAHPAL